MYRASVTWSEDRVPKARLGRPGHLGPQRCVSQGGVGREELRPPGQSGGIKNPDLAFPPLFQFI